MVKPKSIYRMIKDEITASMVYDIVVYRQQHNEFRNWLKYGGITPHLVKQKTVIEYAQRFNISTLVETGTYLGYMVNAVKSKFRRIYSIELDQTLYQRARKKFARFNHISIYHGDSGHVLPEILEEIVQPCLFWLDAHYSGGNTARGELETPIKSELKTIFSHSLIYSFSHTILIDDARNFVDRNNYPTVQELKDFIAEVQPGFTLDIKDDIIRIIGKSIH